MSLNALFCYFVLLVVIGVSAFSQPEVCYVFVRVG